MKMMTLARAVKRLQRKLDIFESSFPQPAPPPTPHPPPPPVTETSDEFRRIFLEDLHHNMNVDPSHRRFREESWAVAFILRTLCPQSYEFQRHLLPFPQIKHIDAHYAEQLNLIASAISNRDSLPALLEHYLALHVPAGYTGKILPSNEQHSVVFHNSQGDGGFIPAVLAVDAMAVEPYSEQTKR
jgi:hypothetical protein